MQVIELWTGGDADLLRQSLRMTNESFAEYLGVAVRTVACWRKQAEIIPRPRYRKPWMRRLSARRTGHGPSSLCWQNAAGGQIARIVRNTGSACLRSCCSVSGAGDSRSAAPG